MTLKNIPGIKNTTFDTGKKSLVVEYDDSTSGRAITQAIVSDAGYEAKLEGEEDSDDEGGEDINIPSSLIPRSQGGNNLSIATFDIS